MQSAIVRDVKANRLASARLIGVTEPSHYSKSHARWLYRKTFGESLGQASKRLRLDRAAFELSYGRLSVRAIARRAGYTSPEAFARAFVRRFGIAPLAYARGRAPTAIVRRAIDIGISFASTCATRIHHHSVRAET